MKKVNYLMAFAIFLLMSNVLHAQEYKIPVQNSKDGKLTLSDFMGDLPVEGYSGNEIIISTASDNEFVTPERAKGLKPIYSIGTDNTGLGLEVEKNGNQVTVQCLLPITKRGEYKIKVPDNFGLKIESGCERSNNIDIQNMKNEIEIKNCQSINLKNVTGPLVLSTISGDIDIVYSNISTDKPVYINSVSGEIDVTLPAKTAVNIEMKTISGVMYSDFDFPTDKNSMKQIAGATVKYPLNGGGVDFKIIAVSGNIYLRKGK
jgi:lia operon protein LiaG